MRASALVVEVDGVSGAAGRLVSSLTVIVLTYNEALHIKRCVRSLQGVAQDIRVVDSFSTDSTLEVLEGLGVPVVQHEFVNHADQFQWALDTLPLTTNWVMRIDADEIVTPALATEIESALVTAPDDVGGFLVNRCVYFQGHAVRHGGHYPQILLRIWRRGQAGIERSWMDEHIVLSSGRVQTLREDLLERNLNNITWWTDKHNRYATREAIGLLDQKYGLLPTAQKAEELHDQARAKRWLKDNLYSRAPLGWRAFLFFVYRVVFRLGFLDGRAGMTFHFLQGFWYRFLVDVKVREVERRMTREGLNCADAIRAEFGVEPRF